MNKKNLITFIRETSTPGVLDISTINADNGWGIIPYTYKMSKKDVSSFFIHIPCFIIHYVKAVILDVYAFEHPDFKSNIHFRRAIIAKLEKHKIPYYFTDPGTFFVTGLFLASRIHSQRDESVVVVRVGKNYLTVMEWIREKFGYRITENGKKEIEFTFPIYNNEKLKENILGDNKENSKKIIIAPFSGTSHLNGVVNLLDREMIYPFGTANIREKYGKEILMEMANMAVDKNRTRYKIFPALDLQFFVEKNVIVYGKKLTAEISCDMKKPNDKIKSFFVPRSHEPYNLKYRLGRQMPKLVEKHPLPDGKHHKMKMALEIDSNMIPKFTQEPYIDPLIEKLPLKLTEKMSSSKRIPIIGFFDNSSIICLWNQKENGYKFCQNWNGLYGEDLFIAFDEEKPKYRKQAMKTLHMKPETVVYDIMNILPAKPDNIYVNPEWPFTITKDEENPILLEFDNFDGTRKLAPPEFLMALLLKDHLKVIKEEIGTKPAEIGIVFFDKIVNTEFWDATLLEENIKKSCDLLKIGCKIVDIDA